MRRKTRSNPSGFTLIEVLVVMVIILIIATFGMPALRETILKAKSETLVQQMRGVFQRARYEAIKQSQEVIVQARPDAGEFRIYIDVPVLDNAGNRTDTPRAFEPVGGVPTHETDRVLQKIAIPEGVSFAAPAGETVVQGFTNLSGGDPSTADVDELVAVFGPEGSVSDIGALRIGDVHKNYFELRLEVAATGKISVRKYDCRLDEWHEKFEGSQSRSRWEWYWNYSGSC
jgi:prepilin-type N-terminal cleavage/methylation domain-containing protein